MNVNKIFVTFGFFRAEAQKIMERSKELVAPALDSLADRVARIEKAMRDQRDMRAKMKLLDQHLEDLASPSLLRKQIFDIINSSANFKFEQFFEERLSRLEKEFDEVRDRVDLP